MSKERIRSILNVEFMSLPQKFDPNYSGNANVAIDPAAVFASQASADRAKRDLSKAQFREVTAMYMANFVTRDGFDVAALEKELNAKRDLLKRHLGKEWMYFLSMLVRLHKETDVQKEIERPRGLLHAVT